MGYGRARRGAAALAVITALALASGTAAGAATLTEDQEQILSETLGPYGFLNADMHREFWAALPAELRNDPAKLRAVAEEDTSVRGAHLSGARWESVKASKAAGRVVETPEYVAEVQRVFARFADSPGATKELHQMAADDLSLLAAAAAGRPTLLDDKEQEVTAGLIDTYLSGVETALFRLERLLDPVWSTVPKDYAYPDADVKIRWDGPFLKDTTGGPLYLTYAYSKGRFVEICRIGKRRWHPDPAAIEAKLKAVADNFGVFGGVPRTGPWRGHASVELSGRSWDGYGSLRAVAVPALGAVYVLLAIAPDAAAAADLRAKLEEAISLE
jgi:hypothetical protein